MYYANDRNFGRILTWNHRNRTDFFEGHCGDIKGSAGEFYPLNIKRDKLLFYSSELCKYAELEYEKDVVIKGVKGYKFSADYLFDNGEIFLLQSRFNISTCSIMSSQLYERSSFQGRLDQRTPASVQGNVFHQGYLIFLLAEIIRQVFCQCLIFMEQIPIIRMQLME